MGRLCEKIGEASPDDEPRQVRLPRSVARATDGGHLFGGEFLHVVEEQHDTDPALARGGTDWLSQVDEVELDVAAVCAAAESLHAKGYPLDSHDGQE